MTFATGILATQFVDIMQAAIKACSPRVEKCMTKVIEIFRFLGCVIKSATSIIDEC
jgi:hypothetical protein